MTPKKRKPRPSRGRGIRSTAGCQTCRARRLKCGEQRPICANCAKSCRVCVYNQKSADAQSSVDTERTAIRASPPARHAHKEAEKRPISDDSHANTDNVQQTTLEAGGTLLRVRDGQDRHKDSATGASPADVALSPATTTSFAAGTAPYHWYDLIARDAWKNAEQYDFLTSRGSRWSFNSSDLPSIPRSIQHSSPSLSLTPLQRWASEDSDRPQLNDRNLFPSSSSDDRSTTGGAGPGYYHDHDVDENSVAEPWNTSQEISLSEREIDYLRHYVDNVSPLFDLFDPQQHFRVHVLRLATRNEGILKSVLAIAALHKALCTSQDSSILSVNSLVSSDTTQTAQSHRQTAAQYYYETISWLSQAMKMPGYAHSREILANAALISWYEASGYDNSENWERHLKGVFWIQRSQNTDGESEGLRKAVWWSWLRQDIWAAIRHSRRTLTIFKPTKMVTQLTRDELACRILFIQAKAVSYASPEAQQALELEQRLSEGQALFATLEEWHRLLPDDFRPLNMTLKSSDSSTYPPVWIHPPMFAAAMQTYHSAKILILINIPSRGGRPAHQERQKMLDQCVRDICGIAEAPNATFPPLAMVNSEALFIAGQSLQSPDHEEEVLKLLQASLDATKILPKTLETELRQLWSSS